MEYRLPKSARVTKRCEYQQLARAGQRLVGTYTLITVRAGTDEEPTRLGITVTKRFGRAHLRNRFKRIVREAFRRTQHEIPKGLTILVKPRPLAKNATSVDLQQELIHQLSPFY